MNFPISIFIDTNVYIKTKYNTSENSSLKIVEKYINEGKLVLYTSRVVIGEVLAHIEKDTIEVVRILNKAKKDSKKLLSESIVTNTDISRIYESIDANDAVKITKERFDMFFTDTKAVIISDSDITISDILADYFSGRPPFEKKASKKNEFPDAFMISQIKSTFNVCNPGIVISDDNGFIEGLRSVNGVQCLRNLKELFNLININDKWIPVIKDCIKSKDFHDEISESIDSQFADGKFDVEGLEYDRKGMSYGHEYDEVYPIYLNIINLKLNTVDDITNDGFIQISIDVESEFEVNCYYDDFDDAIWNSEDKEYIYVPRGQTVEKHKSIFESEVVLKIVDEKDGTLSFDSQSSVIKLDSSTRLSRNYILNENENEEDDYLDII